MVASRRYNCARTKENAGVRLGLFGSTSVSLHNVFLNRLNQLYGKTGYREIALKLQNASSNMCGPYCLFLIHYIAKKPCELSQIDEKLKLCSEIGIIRLINDKYNSLFRYTVR